VWTVAIRSLGAASIRLRIAGWRPPAGAQLYVFSAESPGLAAGPFTDTHGLADQTFWTPSVPGEEVRVEWFLPAVPAAGATGQMFGIDAVIPRFRDEAADAALGLSAPLELGCHVDASCLAAWANAASGVVRTGFVQNGYLCACSGALVNRTAQDLTPLLLTARHCGVDASNVRGLEVDWLFQTQGCNGQVQWGIRHVCGSALLVENPATDTALVGLDPVVPGGTWFLGWDANYWPNGTEGVGIHHPDCSYKRISLGRKTGNSTSCVPADAYRVWYDPRRGTGLVEPGSSGSPIFDLAQRLRGVLSCSSRPSCTEEQVTTYDRLDVAFPSLAAYLDPVEPIHVDGGRAGSGRGTAESPLRTPVEGIFAVVRGGNVRLRAGNYPGPQRISKAMTLHAWDGTVVLGR
jgi:hypothetical protein